MLDHTRAEITAFLAAHQTGILCLAGHGRTWAMPVPYQAHGIVVCCRVPRWADGSYYLETDPHCVLLITAGDGAPCWLSYTALAAPARAPDWAAWAGAGVPPARLADFYTVLRLQPLQIDLFDERRGWGARATLEP